VAEHSYRVLPFGVDGSAPTADLASLHQALLPASPVPLLGRRFMEHFYYSILPRQGSIYGAVAYVGDEAAGFIVVSHDGAGFMRRALREHWARIGWLVGTSMLVSPRRVTYVWESLQIMRSASVSPKNAASGQILSFGVLPRYRQPRFVRETKLRIGVDLMQLGMAQLRRRGVREITAAVHRDNLEAQLFYRGLGWKLTRQGLPGWRVPAVELAWHADESSQADVI